VVEPFIHITPISVTPGNKVRLISTYVPDNPTQLKLNGYNPKIFIARKPQFGKLRKIRRNTGDVENVNDKDVTSFTYKDIKSGIIYYIARKFPSGFSGINDSFEYILTTKTAQPAQGVVPIEIQSPVRGGEDSSQPDIVQADSSFLPFDLICLIAILVGVIFFLLLIILIIKCRSGKKSKEDPAKENPPHLPRPPDFMTMNTRSMYTPSDNESLPVTQSSTPLPVLSNVPHCKVIPIGQLDIQDSDPEDMIDMREDAREQMLRGYGFSEGPESWTSSIGDMGALNDINYSSLAQPQQIPPKINPLLRRNQYWV
jgi:chondroitin sulfate proteoglycan 4